MVPCKNVVNAPGEQISFWNSKQLVEINEWEDCEDNNSSSREGSSRQDEKLS